MKYFFIFHIVKGYLNKFHQYIIAIDNHWVAQSIFANDNHSHYVLYVDSKVSLSAEALLAA